MADDTSKTGGQDRTRINMSEEYELRDWATKLDATPMQIRQAVKAVGDGAADVEMHLKGSHATANADQEARAEESTRVAEVQLTLEARTVTETVAVSPDAVYEFARKMENLPQWASGLAAGVTLENGEWFTQSPMGKVKVEMAPRNDFRVLDHDVTLPNGVKVHNALRVTPALEDSVLTFVVLKMPGTTEEDFAKDVAHVTGDLQKLKKLLESRQAS